MSIHNFAKSTCLTALCAAAIHLPLFADPVNPADYEQTFNVKFVGYSGTTTLTNFPALIRLSKQLNNFDYTKCTDGANLRFADSDGNSIPHEIDTWNSGGESLVWVQVPLLTRNTFIKVYYGYTGLDAQPTVTPTDVWTNGYVAVWHMSAANVTFAQLDSTSNGKHLVSGNNYRAGMQCGVNGAVGTAAELGRDGVTTGGFAASDNDGTLDGFEALTVEAWTCQTAYPTDNHRYLFNKQKPGVNKNAYYGEQLKNTGKIAAYVTKTLNGSESSPGVWQSADPGAALNEWTHQVFRWRGDTGRSDGFINGVNVVTDAAASSKKGTLIQVEGSLYVGNYIYSNTSVFPGTIDEVRVSNIARSADWIVATHDTIANEAFCYFYTDDNPWRWEKYSHRFTVTFPGVPDDVTLTDFPVLVKISESSLIGFAYSDCLKSDGSDLRFADENGDLLSCEVETWNPNGESFIWVKVPTLTKSTKVIGYYGWNLAPAVDSTEVWDANYLAVWHMNAASGELLQKDATANGKAVTGSSSSAVQSGAEGKVGLAAQCGRASTGGYQLSDSSYFDGHSEITVEAWTFRDNNAETLTTEAVIIEMGRFTGNWATAWRMWLATSEKTRFYVVKNGGSHTDWTTFPGDAPAKGEWHYNVSRWAGANGYHSETLDATTATTDSASNFKGTMDTIANGTLCIGNRHTGQSNPFPGCIDEVRISKVARSDAWINATYDTIANNATFTKYGIAKENRAWGMIVIVR